MQIKFNNRRMGFGDFLKRQDDKMIFEFGDMVKILRLFSSSNIVKFPEVLGSDRLLA